MVVSIITCSYNSEKTIRQTIQSVNSQTYPQIEHIFIDGNSTDETINYIHKESKIKRYVLSEEDEGIYNAMNKGINLASGEIITILNSDDFFSNAYIIEEVVNRFKNDKSLELLYGNVHIIDDSMKTNRKWESSSFKKDTFKKGWHPPHPGMFIKSDIYKAFHFNEDFKVAADFELMLRLFEIENIKTYYLNKCIVKMRTGGESMSLRGVLNGFFEINRAFQLHGIQKSPFYFFKRYTSKIIQKL